MSRQGSASFNLVIGGVTVIASGAMILSFFFYPMVDAFMGAPFWDSLETVHGQRLTTYAGGIWVFWGAILLLAFLSWIWVVSRQ